MRKAGLPRAPIARAVLLGFAAGAAILWLLGIVLPRAPWRLPPAASHPELLALATPAFDVVAAAQNDLADAVSGPAVAAVQHNNAGVAAARERDWARAAEQLREALGLDPQSEAIRRNLQQVLLAWGVEQLRAGKRSAAEGLLAEASQLRRDADVDYWLGKCRLQQGNRSEAERIWQQALEQFPEHPYLLFGLGEAAEQRDDRVQALDYFLRARKAGLNVPGLDEKIERLGREVDAEWEYTISRSARFDFRHPAFDRREVLDLVVASFEAAYDHLLATFGVGPTAPVRVVLYPSADFYAVTRSPDWAGGAYSGRIQLPVGGLVETDRDQLERVARHELVHALVSEWSRGQAPGWLQEGLAMWGERNRPDERRSWAETLVSQAHGVSLERLPQSLATLEQAQAEVAYALSYLAVLSLVERYGIHRVLSFVQATGEQPWRNAFASSFGSNFEEFAGDL